MASEPLAKRAKHHHEAHDLTHTRPTYRHLDLVAGAQQGDASAQFNLAVTLMNGDADSLQNDAEAVKWQVLCTGGCWVVLLNRDGGLSAAF